MLSVGPETFRGDYVVRVGLSFFTLVPFSLLFSVGFVMVGQFEVSFRSVSLRFRFGWSV